MMSLGFGYLTPDLGIRLLVNCLFLLFVIRGLYYSRYRDQEFAFSCVLFSVTVFFLTALLRDVELSLGFTFGLFAVFVMLQFRTSTISAKGMTYLFLSIAAAMLNAVSPLSLLELVIVNLALALTVLVAQSQPLFRQEESVLILYEKLDLLQAKRRPELLADLQQRMGLHVHRIVVEDVDLLRDTATLKVFYFRS